MTSSKNLGLTALIEKYELRVSLPVVHLLLASRVRRTEIKENQIIESYPKSYKANTTYEQIKFALRYEPF